MFLELLLLFGIGAYLFYRWATAKNDFFLERGLPYEKPSFFFGAMKAAVLRKKSLFDLVRDIYNKHNGQIYGIFEQRNPLLVIRDPELIKKIAVKDFDHFINHRSFMGDEDNEDLFSNSLFLLKNSKWKDMRSTLSPVFTGSKMRHMFELINIVTENTAKFLEKKVKDKDGVELDVKDFCRRFTNDIIASAAFGVQVNSFEDVDNEFYHIGKKTMTFTTWQNIKFFLFANFAPLMKFLKIPLFPKETSDYFMNLVIGAMKYRKEHNIVRPDMIHMLMEARGMIESDHHKTHNREWTDAEIVAQCFLFFFAGFDTSSTLMCFAAHELMENPDIQQKLFEEIEEVVRDLDGRPLTYDALHGMKYLDMVISETLRKWPPAIATDRVCNKDITYDLEDGSQMHLKNGDCVWLPIVGLHYDEKYFENPLKYDPERFSDENKSQIQPFTYMPFGVGPRNCIGNRFALMEAKALIFYIIKNFRIVVGEKTSVPLKVCKKSFQMTAENGFWMKFVPRE